MRFNIIILLGFLVTLLQPCILNAQGGQQKACSKTYSVKYLDGILNDNWNVNETYIRDNLCNANLHSSFTLEPNAVIALDSVRIKVDLQNFSMKDYRIETISLHILRVGDRNNTDKIEKGNFLTSQGYGSVNEFNIGSMIQSYHKIPKNLLLRNKNATSDRFHLFWVKADKEHFEKGKVVEFCLYFEFSEVTNPKLKYKTFSDRTYFITRL